MLVEYAWLWIALAAIVALMVGRIINWWIV
jgi:hypothetical protein